MTINRDGISHSPVKQAAAYRFASLSVARAYIDTVREKVSSFSAQALIGAMEHLNRAYQEYPELELDRPRRDLSEGLRSAVKNLPDHLIIRMLIDLMAFDPTASASMTLLFEKITASDNWRWLSLMLRSFDPSIRLHWSAFEPVVAILPQRGREDINLSFFAELLKRIDFGEEEGAADFGNILAHLLSDERPASVSGRHRRRNVRARIPTSSGLVDGCRLTNSLCSGLARSSSQLISMIRRSLKKRIRPSCCGDRVSLRRVSILGC